MRILFMGTPEFAVPSLEKLREKHEIVGIFTKVDKPNTRGKKIKYTPVKEYGLNNDIPVYQPNSLKTEETFNLIKELNPDLIVVVAYGKIIPNNIIEFPKFGIINVHSSLLPKFRGAAPINAAIIAGEKESGVTIMDIAEELDAGDIILKGITPIYEEDTFLTLHDRLKVIGSEKLIEAVDQIENGTAKREKQDHQLATFVKPYKKTDCMINWNKTKEEIFNFVRGMNPFPTAYTLHNDKVLKVYSVEKLDKIYENGEIGEIVDSIKGKGFVIKVKDGSVILMEIKPENKKIISGKDSMNGNLFKIGEILK
ncbi:methionyl-tRNA formyltransferase [Candidatus Cetobacterium colombiensis]|uniref:Methionyl-tRNA formyltransferase n=1 Tax=Candidatus Cetobacterium colombiensis TaxID=3073100 RepID=A0ABU4WCK3_9FUSO|nr:methionyl-tRNA formyltransferase [Candidatus Cetobacterium colombiensis]MDX8336248.1 methionyl-tRNA formyltransferase [Candidatus Cetobacterium colombiensis]